MGIERIREADLILPALFVMNARQGVTTTDMIALLRDLLQPSGEDLAQLNGRNDDKFSQKVRNLVSHRTLERLGFATYPHDVKSGIHRITDAGKALVFAQSATIEYLLGNDFGYDDVKQSFADIAENVQTHRRILVYDENVLIEEGSKRIKEAQTYERSKLLRNYAVDHYTVDGHIACIVCTFDFLEVYGEIGRGYVEIHHQKSVFQYEDEDMAMFMAKALDNVVPVCANCHRMIHRKRSAPLTVADLQLRLLEASARISG